MTIPRTCGECPATGQPFPETNKKVYVVCKPLGMMRFRDHHPHLRDCPYVLGERTLDREAD